MKFLSSVQIHFSWWQSCLENFHMDCQVNLRRLVTVPCFFLPEPINWNMVKPSVRGHPCKRKSVCLWLLSPHWGLTTALLNGSWVLGVSRGFHFWLPAAGGSVQPSHEPPPEKEKTGTFRGEGRHNKSNCQPFGHMTYIQFPVVCEKNIFHLFCYTQPVENHP